MAVRARTLVAFGVEWSSAERADRATGFDEASDRDGQSAKAKGGDDAGIGNVHCDDHGGFYSCDRHLDDHNYWNRRRDHAFRHRFAYRDSSGSSGLYAGGFPHIGFGRTG